MSKPEMSTHNERSVTSDIDKILERCCEIVIKSGYATGHADTVEELVEHLCEQIKATGEVQHKVWIDGSDDTVTWSMVDTKC